MINRRICNAEYRHYIENGHIIDRMFTNENMPSFKYQNNALQCDELISIKCYFLHNLFIIFEAIGLNTR